MIAATVNLAAVDTGYNLYTLLNNTKLPIRCTELVLQWENNIVYVVPVAGTITTTTGTVPDQYGALIDTTTRVLQLGPQSNGNGISLQDVIVAASAANTVLHVLAYSL